jgi:hypothetical protein
MTKEHSTSHVPPIDDDTFYKTNFLDALVKALRRLGRPSLADRLSRMWEPRLNFASRDIDATWQGKGSLHQ